VLVSLYQDSFVSKTVGWNKRSGSTMHAVKTLIQVKMTQVRNVFLNGQGNVGEFMQDFYFLNLQKH